MLSPYIVREAHELVDLLATYDPENNERQKTYSLQDVVLLVEQLTLFKVDLFDIAKGVPYKRLTIIRVKARQRELTPEEIDEIQPFGRLFSQELATAALEQLFLAQALIFQTQDTSITAEHTES